MTESKHQQITELRKYFTRLKILVSELLAKANEADEQAAYLGLHDEHHSKQLRATCGQLVTLSETLPEIERMIQEEHLDSSREAILKSLHAAEMLSQRLQSLKLVEPRVID